MKTKWKLITSVICIFFLLSACSYKEFEDSMKSKLNKEEEEEYINPAIVPEASSQSEKEDDSKSDEKKLYTVGDTITYSYPGDEDETFQYTLKKVQIVDNINELGLKKDDFTDSLFIETNGDITKNYRLLTVDVLVKNIEYNIFDEEGDTPILFIEDGLGFKEAIEDPNGPFLFEAAYFSEHSLGNKDYYKFPLAIGEEVEATIGWFVPADQIMEEPIYYVIGTGGQFENYEYFELTFE